MRKTPKHIEDKIKEFKDRIPDFDKTEFSKEILEELYFALLLEIAIEEDVEIGRLSSADLHRKYCFRFTSELSVDPNSKPSDIGKAIFSQGASVSKGKIKKS